jgi:hypothetical protein
MQNSRYLGLNTVFETYTSMTEYKNLLILVHSEF